MSPQPFGTMETAKLRTMEPAEIFNFAPKRDPSTRSTSLRAGFSVATATEALRMTQAFTRPIMGICRLILPFLK